MQEVKELFSHQEGGQVVAKAGSQKPVIALIVACGQIVAGKGSATELQQAPVSVPSFMTICSNQWLHCIIQPRTLHAVSFTIQLLVSCWCVYRTLGFLYLRQSRAIQSSRTGPSQRADFSQQRG